MYATENGTHAEIPSPAVKKDKHEGPYPSSFACAVTINRPADELYAFWRDFTNLPKFMANIESVTCADDRRLWRLCRRHSDGAIMQKGLTIRTGQTHVQKYTKHVLDMNPLRSTQPS
jgi:hypothetical protein